MIERSPSHGHGFPTDGVVDEFMSIENVERIGSCVAIMYEADNMRFVVDPGLAQARVIGVHELRRIDRRNGVLPESVLELLWINLRARHVKPLCLLPVLSAARPQHRASVSLDDGAIVKTSRLEFGPRYQVKSRGRGRQLADSS